ncbi:MAG TPA: hypothetical protein VE152_14005, partial [Acidimicrobiales bacterium]|nr:hypothetical protein [Acidimicrobiales bacterium]
NGGLNCSVLDGWWDEMWTGDNGWAISSAEDAPDQDHRDAVEAARLFDLLEQQVVPLFYDRPDGALPTGWLRRIKASLQTLGPQVVASRMVRQYTEAIYEPAARRAASLRVDDYRGARDLAAWKARVRDAWSRVAVEAVEAEASSAELGAKRRVEAVVRLGDLDPSDVAVQLLHGPVGDGGELARAGVVDMAPAGTTDGPGGEEDGRWRYAGSFACTQAGRHGFTVRILPSHEGLAAPTDLGLVAWA